MDVFKYSDYRTFLQDWLRIAKKERRSSAALLASQIGIHASFLSQVLLEKKDLTADHWTGLCELFDISEIERDFLQFVFLKNRAGTPSGRKYYQRKLDEILKRRLQLKERMKDQRELSEEDRAEFYSSWLYSAVRLYCGVGGGQTLDTITQKFHLNKNRAEEIINFLVRIGLCNLQNGKITLGDLHLHIPAESPFVSKHHLNWRVQGIQSLDKVNEDELHFTAPMSIARKDFLIIREKIVKLIQESVAIAKNSEAEDLAAMTIDFFWPIKK